MFRSDSASESSGFRWHVIALVIALALGTSSVFASDDDDSDSDSGDQQFCSATALLQFRACKNEIRDDHLVAKAICINVSDETEREECFEDAQETRSEDRELCLDQRHARLELCDLIGEDRYDPDFDPENFDADFSNLTNPNPYFPLGIGNVWQFESEDETIRIEVLDETKLIDGVTCIVVNDVVEEDGETREDTDDWFAHHLDGTITYCGEIVMDFESFDGDNPAVPELTEIEGSFKAGRDGDKSGTLFLGTPVVGATYRQEWSASNAEDVAMVLSTTYSFGSDPDLDAFVPEDLADLLCAAGDCVVTQDFSTLDPGALEYKYYADGIGLFLETEPETGDISQLVDCNFNSLCDVLPTP